MAYALVFPLETEQVAKAVYDQIIKLRSISRDLMLTNLKKTLKQESSLQVALVLIADDPTQIRIVSHLPTMVFEDLRCAKLVYARMQDKLKEAGKPQSPSTISREEFNDLVTMVKEVPNLIVQAKEAMIVEIATIGEAQIMGKHEMTANTRQVADIVRSSIVKVDEVLSLNKALAERITHFINDVYRFIRHMFGFTREAGYKDPEVELERGIRHALFGPARR